MDDLKLDPNVLEYLAALIERYCSTQEDILIDYRNKMMALSSEWSDDKTFGGVMQEISLMSENVVKLIDQIRFYYPKYFRNRAVEIRNMPKMD